MNRGEALDWAICGAGLRSDDRAMHDALAAQDYLYTCGFRSTVTGRFG
ncbi:hypothetical protein LT20_03198 [Pseudomonas aeruginosa]|nr:hypothetical protein LT20_03198 [Pseudomonas aeruginosa]